MGVVLTTTTQNDMLRRRTDVRLPLLARPGTERAFVFLARLMIYSAMLILLALLVDIIRGWCRTAELQILYELPIS